MKCPNCGAQIQDGKLYCGNCGREIQIVPEFEPEIENSIHLTLSNVITDLTEAETDGKGHKKKEKAGKKRARRTGRKKKFLLWGTAVLLLLGIVSVAWSISFFTPSLQYQKGMKALNVKQLVKAERFLTRASELAPENTRYLNSLSECYSLEEKHEKAMQTCLKILALEDSNEEAYGRLIALYGRKKEYRSISDLLEECKSEEIRSRYREYLADVPKFSEDAGTYRESIKLELSAEAEGVIYYTTDGTEPDKNAFVYTGPIRLDSGSYVIKAMYENTFGVTSKIAVQEYYIDVKLPDAPDVSPVSGSYYSPTLIELTVPEDCQVFYTTDKTDPGPGSRLYEGPFWMPVGYSDFHFVAVSPGGAMGEVTKRQYTLALRPVLSMEAAANQLSLTLKNAGIVLNLQGELSGGGHNLYTYKYTLSINDHNYYLFREYFEEKAGSSNATGNEYVVNYMSGECYRAEKQEDGTFKLFDIGLEETDTDGKDES